MQLTEPPAMFGPAPREGVASFPGIARPNRALHGEDTSRHAPEGAPRLVFGHIESNVDIRRCVLYTARTSAITMSPLS
jgi:hypothetical protein